MLRNKKLKIVIAIFVLLDLVPLFRHDVTIGTLPETEEDHALVQTLKEDKTLFRFLPNYYQGDLVRGNLEFDAPMKYGIYSTSGYDQPPLKNYYQFLMAIGETKMSDILQYIETTPPINTVNTSYIDFLNIKYIFVPITQDTLALYPDHFQLTLDRSERGYRLYENRHVLPRYYMVRKALFFPNETELTSSLSKIDPSQEVGLRGKSPTFVSSCPDTLLPQITLISSTPTEVTVRTNTACDAYLVSSEVMYPGWNVYIDGKRQPLLIGNIAFRTVFVPSGDHLVQFVYTPFLWYGSFFISLASLGCCSIILFRKKQISKIAIQ